MSKKEKKSRLSPKAQKIVDTVGTIVEFALVILCLVISVFVIANPGGVRKDKNGSTLNSNVNLVPVLSNSMDPTFKKGDLIFGDRVENPGETIVDIGTVIMFLSVNDANKTYFINSHRVIGYCVYADGEAVDIGDFYNNGTKPEDYDYKNYIVPGLKAEDTINYLKTNKGVTNATIIGYYTKGDNNSIYYTSTGGVSATHDPDVVKLGNVLATIATKNNGQVKRVGAVGGVITWMKSPLHFGLIIMIPLVLLFAYNIWVVIKYVLEQKEKKIKAAAIAEAQKANAPVIDEEEIKRKAIEEYLARQAAEQAAKNDDSNKDSSN